MRSWGAAPAYADPHRQLRYGMRGPDVQALQRRLAALRYYPGAANGQFGANTLEAVWAVFFIQDAYAIHGEPAYGPFGGGVPLNPVSHGCVRIPYDIAQFFHRLVKTRGTPVYIY